MNAWSETDHVLLCSPATTAAIESERALRLIAASCATDLGRDWVGDLEATASRELLEARRADVDLVGQTAWGGRPTESLPPLLGLRQALQTEQADIGTTDARLLAMAVAALHRARAALNDADSDAPLIAATASLPDFDDWSRTTLRSLDENGEVRDDATPRLRSLLSSYRTQRNRLRGALAEYLRDQPDVVDDTISLRDGRMTVLLRSTSEEASRGVRHGISGSGQSVYVEPLAAVEGNNGLRQTGAEAEAEKRRIAAEILDFVASNRQQMADILDWLARVDGIGALALWRHQGEACWAEIGDPPSLIGFRHPLLDVRFAAARSTLFGPAHEGDAEPLIIDLDSGLRLLVITGPNAGGKTVTIKSLGLAVFLNQCGVPLPTESARLPLFAHLEGLIGDDQDLLAARSTFSGRLERLRTIWERADQSSLVLIDELGSGTDPDEGSALAVALLENLASRGVTTVVTTHLIGIAAFAAEHPQGAAAAMEFEDGAPTFRLIVGTPGESHALDLARRLQLPTEWLERAETLLGAERVSLSQLMRGLELERQELRTERGNLEAMTAAAETEREAAAREREALVAEHEQAARRLRKRQDEFERQALRRIDTRLEKLERELKRKSAAKVDRAERGRVLKEALHDRPSAESAPVEKQHWKQGDPVRHHQLSWTGTVVATRGDRAQVAAGGKKIWLDGSELVAADPDSKPDVAIAVTSGGPAQELHLLGFTVDDALDALDEFLLQVHAAGSDQVRVVHGHGTGRLRRAVRDHLGRHRLVTHAAPAPPAEGGDGATIVELTD